MAVSTAASFKMTVLKKIPDKIYGTVLFINFYLTKDLWEGIYVPLESMLTDMNACYFVTSSPWFGVNFKNAYREYTNRELAKSKENTIAHLLT